MRISIPCLALLVAAGCAGDPPPGSGRACSGDLYDACLQEHDCMSNNCRSFQGDGIQVCTQGCSASVPCPKTSDDKTVMCDMETGSCKPPAANACTRP